MNRKFPFLLQIGPWMVAILFFHLQSCQPATKENTEETSKEASPYPGYELVWEDSFEGSSLDTSKWSYEVNDKGGGNNELQYYTDRSENLYLEDNKLVIKAIKESYKTRDYTSARIRTLGKGDWKYGRMDIRAKMPEGQGIWPAIWMMPSENKFGGWPKSGEIDIMEMLGHQTDTLYGTVHFGPGWPKNKHVGGKTILQNPNMAEEFFTYSIHWEKDMITWLVDDQSFFHINPDSLKGENYPFNESFHLILNLAVGGNWPGNPDETTRFPQHMYVDYVRVYQKEGN